ncbi:MAG: redoxin domain-containing protein [Bacteroidota bacterium]|nr:redoxin domain-containing protein [Bacteroidota bacterium]
MKYLLFLFSAILISHSGFSQNVDSIDNRPIYIRFPSIPEFTIYKAPDSTAFTREDLHKRKATVIMVFSPDCGHCQNETNMLIKNINRFKNTQIIMVTYLPYSEMMKFYSIYKIANYPQITMGRDTKYFFPIFFKIQNLPSIFVYDKKGNFKQKFEGDVNPEKILEELQLN